MTARHVRFGVDRVARHPHLLPRASRVGLVTNQAARPAGEPSTPSRVALREAGVPLVRLFSPEHGLSALGEDGAPMTDATDPVTGLSIVSLYGERFAPPDEALADLDLVLFDIPDVGARFYTYAWTLSHVLESCARTGTPLVVLDRPNPLGGRLDRAEGPLLDEAHCASFIGRWAIPIRHALTLGELATHWALTRVRAAPLHVIRCEGWARDACWPALGLPWIPTSPSMPSFASAMVYPGLCLFEATNLSVGRGTDAPFQCIAAPWLDAPGVIAALSPAARTGVTLHPGSCTPTLGPHRGTPCAAVWIAVDDVETVRPVALGLSLLAAVIRRHERHFAWATYPTAANPTGGDHFARLVGERGIAARLLETDRPVSDDEVARWTAVPSWPAAVRDALLYGPAN
jgi:uncharacterized protein YbbC (DUF1343 family)